MFAAASLWWAGFGTIDQVPTVFLNLEKLPTWNKDWQERDSRPHKTAWTVAEEFCCMHLHSSTCVCVSVHRKLKVWTRQDTKGSQTRLFFKDLQDILYVDTNRVSSRNIYKGGAKLEF